MTTLSGACHCGAVTASLVTEDAGALTVRACQCGFCRRRGAKTVGDPNGHLRVSFSQAAVERYRFGTRSAEFLICKGCGDYMAAVMDSVAVLNVVAADIPSLAGRDAEPMVYDSETPEEKRARRLARWTPVTLEVRP
jgi:hypothetical protein